MAKLRQAYARRSFAKKFQGWMSWNNATQGCGMEGYFDAYKTRSVSKTERVFLSDDSTAFASSFSTVLFPALKEIPMRYLSLAAVIGGVLVGAATNAENHDLYMGGSSSQMEFWRTNLLTTICGTNPLTTYTVGAPGTVSIEAWRCAAGVTTVPNIALNDQVTVHYNSELGSVAAIAQAAATGGLQRLFINPSSLDCVGTVCAATYDSSTESFTSASGTALIRKDIDIGVWDVNSKHWMLATARLVEHSAGLSLLWLCAFSSQASNTLGTKLSV